MRPGTVRARFHLPPDHRASGHIRKGLSTMRTPWKQTTKTSEHWINGLVRRYKAAVRPELPKELRAWLRGAYGRASPPTSKDIIFIDLKWFRCLPPSGHVEFHRTLDRLYLWATKEAGVPPDFANSWGDAVHAIYDSPPRAAAFSLAFVEAAREVDWRRLGLPGTTNFRAAVHRGRVWMLRDEILGRDLFVGDSLTFAARLEPVAVPGQVITSRAFAEAFAASGNQRFECRSLGTRFLPKTEHRFPAYELIRKGVDQG
jgi:class 3 adenylate cyclase